MSPNPSQGEVPEKAERLAFAAVEEPRLSLPKAAIENQRTTIRCALAAALPAIRSQIDKEWEERLKEVQAKVDKMGPELEAEFKLRGHEEQEREKAEERLKEVERQREEWRGKAERYRVEWSNWEEESKEHEDARDEAEAVRGMYRERAEKAEADLANSEAQVRLLRERSGPKAVEEALLQREEQVRGAILDRLSPHLPDRFLCSALEAAFAIQPSSTSPQQEVEELLDDDGPVLLELREALGDELELAEDWRNDEGEEFISNDPAVEALGKTVGDRVKAKLAQVLTQPPADPEVGEHGQRFKVPPEDRCLATDASRFRCEYRRGHPGDHMRFTGKRTIHWAEFPQPEADPEVPRCGYELAKKALRDGSRVRIKPSLHRPEIEGTVVSVEVRDCVLDTSAEGLGNPRNFYRAYWAELDGFSILPGDCQPTPELLGEEADAFCLSKYGEDFDAFDAAMLKDWAELLLAMKADGWRVVQSCERGEGQSPEEGGGVSHAGAALLHPSGPESDSSVSTVESTFSRDGGTRHRDPIRRCQPGPGGLLDSTQNANAPLASPQPVSESPGNGGVGLDQLERWMVDYEGEEGGPVETKLSWISGPDGDPTTKRPEVGDYLVRLRDVEALLSTQPVPGNSGGVEEGLRARLLEEVEKARQWKVAPGSILGPLLTEEDVTNGIHVISLADFNKALDRVFDAASTQPPSPQEDSTDA